jgi:hypothetical protein
MSVLGSYQTPPTVRSAQGAAEESERNLLRVIVGNLKAGGAS